jgi:hypothetical protein
MSCEDWELDDAPERSVASVTVRAADIRVESGPTGPTLRWTAGGELSLRVRPDVVYRIHAGRDFVVLEVGGSGDGELLGARTAVERVGREEGKEA